MKDYFEIYGTPIKYANIKEFRIVQKEYIYRPSYIETVCTEQKFMFKATYTTYTFKEMIPFAAIMDESDRRGVLNGIKAGAFKEAIGKEILGDIRETVGEKFNVKAIKTKRYKCINSAGRIFSTYLDEIPALVVRTDGRFTDISKDDATYSMLGESIMPAINMIHALIIQAEQPYIFYGNGVQLDDIHAEYERLKFEIDEYNQQKKTQKKLFSKPSNEGIEEKQQKEFLPFPKITLPSFKKDQNKTTEQEIIAVKKMLEEGVITEEECKEKIQQIIDSI